MFSLGVITDEISQDFERAVEIAKKNNLDFVELRSVWDKLPHALDTPDIRKIKDILAKADLKVIGIASPVFKCHIEKENEYQEHLEFLKRSINLAHQFNTDIIRIFTFWKKEISLEQNWDLLIERFGAAIELAKKEKIKLALENEHSCLVGTGKELARFLDALKMQSEVQSPKSKDLRLKTQDSRLRIDFPVFALWDPCNEIFAGVTKPPFPSGYEPIADRMIHLHIKDSTREGSVNLQAGGGTPKCVPIGDGWLDWEGQFRALITNNYNGGASLETHWRPDYAKASSGKPDSRSFSAGSPKMDLTRPGGSAFSSLGEEASQICLDRIFAIFSKLNLRPLT